MLVCAFCTTCAFSNIYIIFRSKCWWQCCGVALNLKGGVGHLINTTSTAKVACTYKNLIGSLDAGILKYDDGMLSYSLFLCLMKMHISTNLQQLWLGKSRNICLVALAAAVFKFLLGSHHLSKSHRIESHENQNAQILKTNRIRTLFSHFFLARSSSHIFIAFFFILGKSFFTNANKKRFLRFRCNAKNPIYLRMILGHTSLINASWLGRNAII